MVKRLEPRMLFHESLSCNLLQDIVGFWSAALDSWTLPNFDVNSLPICHSANGTTKYSLIENHVTAGVKMKSETG